MWVSLFFYGKVQLRNAVHPFMTGLLDGLLLRMFTTEGFSSNFSQKAEVIYMALYDWNGDGKRKLWTINQRTMVCWLLKKEIIYPRNCIYLLCFIHYVVIINYLCYNTFID